MQFTWKYTVKNWIHGKSFGVIKYTGNLYHFNQFTAVSMIYLLIQFLVTTRQHQKLRITGLSQTVSHDIGQLQNDGFEENIAS